MRAETLSLLCNPYKGEPFKREGDTLVGIASGQTFPIRQGIPVILDQPSQALKNRFSQGLYNLTAFAYDPVVHWSSKLKVSSEEAIRSDYIASFNIQSGQLVFESSVGTASNTLYLPPHADYYGQDISWSILRVAQRKLKKAGREIELFQGDGAYIPFRDSTFDLVFQMGSLQFYADPFRAVSEMARLAKPGTTIHILDEVGGAIRTLKRLPAHAKFASDKETAVKAMPRLVPHSMQEIDSQILPGGDFYALTFQKPG
jgi:ubiquinone/menaquinone biosynthesis C-methylase UbiE/uncharacterized protein YbaR (Trm112 family)